MTNVHRSSCRVHVIFVIFLRKLNFLHIFSKNSRISNFIQIFSVGDDLAHADGRTDGRAGRLTDITKLIVAIRNFPNASKTAEIKFDDCYVTN